MEIYIIENYDPDEPFQGVSLEAVADADLVVGITFAHDYVVLKDRDGDTTVNGEQL